MKYILLISFLICIYSAPTYNELYSIPSQYYNNAPEYYQNGVIFVNNFIYYPNNGSWKAYFPISGCNDPEAYIITPNYKFYCISNNVNFTNLTQFNPYTKAIINTYLMKGNYEATSLGNQIILYNPNPQNHSLGFQIFDTIQEEFTCFYGPFPLTQVPSSIYAYNFSLLWTTHETNGVSYYYSECESSSYTLIELEPGKDNIQDNWLFNDSTIFVEYYSYNGANYLMAFYFENMTIHSQIPLEIVDFFPLNDTHFLYSYQDPMGFLNFDISVYDRNLNPVRVSTHNISVVTAFAPVAQPIIGLDAILVNFDELTYQYNFDTNHIVWVAGVNPAITLANGSVINMTNFGYFFQNPGGNISFHSAPASSVFQVAEDPAVYYSLYIPTGKYPTYPNCSLLTINTTSSSISITKLISCPLDSQTNAYYVKDVDYDNNGNVYVAYKQQLSYYIYVASSVAQAARNYLTPKYFYSAVDLDAQNNVTTILLGFVSSITVQKMNLFNASVISSQTISGQLNNYVYHLIDVYFLVGETSTTQSTLFYLLNSTTNQVISNFTAGVAISPLVLENFMVPYFALGADLSNPNLYDGIVCWTLNRVFLYNSLGQGGQLNLNGLSFQGAFLYSDNSFVVVGLNGTYTYSSMLYQVTNWGTLEYEVQYLEM